MSDQLPKTVQDMLQSISKAYQVDILVTRPDIDAKKWRYTFRPPSPPAQHADSPRIEFASGAATDGQEN